MSMKYVKLVENSFVADNTFCVGVEIMQELLASFICKRLSEDRYLTLGTEIPLVFYRSFVLDGTDEVHTSPATARQASSLFGVK